MHHKLFGFSPFPGSPPQDASLFIQFLIPLMPQILGFIINVLTNVLATNSF